MAWSKEYPFTAKDEIEIDVGCAAGAMAFGKFEVEHDGEDLHVKTVITGRPGNWGTEYRYCANAEKGAVFQKLADQIERSHLMEQAVEDYEQDRHDDAAREYAPWLRRRRYA